MTKPSVDAERLQTVQRVARYVLSRSTVGQTHFGSLDIFPPELPAPKSGTPEYAWRQQLAWTWARAGYLHEALAGSGLQRRRIYTMLQAGREALERIAVEHALASFYVPNKRTANGANDRPAEFFRPPELARMTSADRPLRLVPAKTDPKVVRLANSESTTSTKNRTMSDEESESEETGDAQDAEGASASGDLGEIKVVLAELSGLPVFFERITAVLEHMNERLVKVEGETRDQSALLVEASKRMTLEREALTAGSHGAERGGLEGGEESSKDAPVTRDEIATALAELTQSFVRDNPQNAVFAASLKKQDESNAKLAGEIAALKAEVLAKKTPPIDVAALRAAIAEETSRVLSKDVSKLMGPMVREALSEEFAPSLTPVMEALIRTETKFEAHADALALSGKKELERVLAIPEKIDGVTKKLEATRSGIDVAAEKLDKTAGVMDQRFAAHDVAVTKIIEERFAALQTGITSKIESRLEERLAALTEVSAALRGLPDKIAGEISATCGELKEDLASISQDAQDLAERVEALTDNFDDGLAEFKRQGEATVANLKYVSGAAEVVLEGAHAVAKEMIILARLRAAEAGVTYEETVVASNAAITRVAEAHDEIVSSVTALGGGLIRPQGAAPLTPIVRMPKKKDKEDKP